MKTLIKNSKGFSLIEILVVVAIISVMVAIAIPTFERQREMALLSDGILQMDALRKEMIIFYGFNDHYPHFGELGYEVASSGGGGAGGPGGYYAMGGGGGSGNMSGFFGIQQGIHDVGGEDLPDIIDLGPPSGNNYSQYFPHGWVVRLKMNEEGDPALQTSIGVFAYKDLPKGNHYAVVYFNLGPNSFDTAAIHAFIAEYVAL